MNIADILKENEIQFKKVERLEVIYENMEDFQSDISESEMKKKKHLTIFDTIRNKIASESAASRIAEQELREENEKFKNILHDAEQRFKLVSLKLESVVKGS